MDSRTVAPTTNTEATAGPQSAPNNLLSKLKNLSTTKKALLGIGVIAVIAVLAFLLTRQSTEKNSNETIAMVGNTAIPKKYLDIELEYYPSTHSAETTKMLTDKLINDEITLQYGKEQGWVDANMGLEVTSNYGYLARTNEVKKIKTRIEEEADGISGSLVAIWFRNNGFVGPLGLAKGKEIAYNKLLPLYTKVKNKELTMDQVAKEIIADTNLKNIDPSYDSNAIAPFDTAPGEKITFWPEFDRMLTQTKPGELTQLYLGRGPDDKGNQVDELYMFGQVDKLEGSKGYSSYETWLDQRKKTLNLSSASLKELIKRFSNWPEVYAQANDNNQHGTPGWKGVVETPTGAPVPGALLTFGNPCSGASWQNLFPRDYITYSGGDGKYDQAPMPYINCGCNPNSVKAYVNNPGTADSSFMKTANAATRTECTTTITEISIPNQVATVTHNVTCTPPNYVPPPPPTPPSPTPPPPPPPPPTPPPPPPACNSSCTTNEQCAANKEGCVQCVAGACRIPPACNVNCDNDFQCADAKDGCTSCAPDNSGTGKVCRPPAACNVTCANDFQCAGAKDGCTTCQPSDTGAGKVCRPAPACNVACANDFQCAAAKDGCTTCVNGSCRVPPACATACTTKAECSGAKDGCTECAEGTCTDYNDNMCKCDGIVADLTYPSNAFKFEAFGKVEGSDVKKAEIADITFRLTKDNQVVAKSNPITPELVENSANKLRFKAAWQTPPPPVSKGATYRVFADVRCKPKRIVADTSQTSSPVPVAAAPVKSFAPKGLELIASVINNLSGNNNDQIKALTSKALAFFSTPTANAQNNDGLQLKTLNFVKLMDTDNCRFVMFKYDETLF